MLGLAIGFVIAKVLEKNKATKIIKNARKEASTILKEAKLKLMVLKKIKFYKRKKNLSSLKSEHEKVIIAREIKRLPKLKNASEIKNLKFLKS